MAIDKFTYEDYIQYQAVSRETFDKLAVFVELLEKWQKKINLISPSTLKEIWIRHVVDSGQLHKYVSKDDMLLDIGSGGGFPGLVLGILGIKSLTLVESDRRKSLFLKEAARITEVDTDIRNERIERLPLKSFSLITARAFAPLKLLLGYLEGGLEASHKILLLKGKGWLGEVEIANSHWSFDYSHYPSVTDKQGVVLALQNIIKKGG